jgi:hypothetical protein
VCVITRLSDGFSLVQYAPGHHATGAVAGKQPKVRSSSRHSTRDRLAILLCLTPPQQFAQLSQVTRTISVTGAYLLLHEEQLVSGLWLIEINSLPYRSRRWETRAA